MNFHWNPELEREYQRNNMAMNHSVNTVSFRNIPHTVLSEMAKYLDTYGDANWEALADLHGLSQVHIQVNNLVSVFVWNLFICV